MQKYASLVLEGPARKYCQLRRFVAGGRRPFKKKLQQKIFFLKKKLQKILTAEEVRGRRRKTQRRNLP